MKHRLRPAQEPDLQRDIVRLAVPTVLEGLLITCMQYVDTAMVGSLGAVATAAVAINAAPSWLINGILSAVGVGGTAVVSRAVGAGEQQEAEQAAFHAMAGACCLGLLLTLLMLGISSALPRWLGAETEVQGMATAYLRILAIAYVPQYLGVVLAATLRGAGDMKTPLFLSLAVNLLNIAGNYFLIYPSRQIALFGNVFCMPGAGWGVAGAALSTAVASALYGVGILHHMRGKRTRLRLHKCRLEAGMLRRIARIGTPAAMERIAVNLGQILFTRIVAGFGTQALAAHHLAIQIEALGYQAGFGVAQAATTLVGQSLGAGQVSRAERAGTLCNRFGVLLMSGAALVLFFFGGSLMRLFTPDAAVIQIGAGLLRVCAVYEPFFAMSIVMTGALRGAGDTQVPFVISLVCMWVVRMGVAWLLAFRLGLGIYGAWIGMAADIALRGVLMVLRFRKGVWKSIRV